LLLYARATATGGKMGERGSVDIRPKLSADQRADHQIVLNVRNRALAHVYVREPFDGHLWHDDMLFVVETPHGWKPAAASKRLQFHRDVFDRLKRQLPIALEILTAKFHKQMDAVTDFFSAEPVPLEIFEASTFDPVAVFGNRAAVAEVLAGMASGKATVLT
jgi:hypothetical protein